MKTAKLPIIERRRQKRAASKTEPSRARARLDEKQGRDLSKHHVLVNPANLRPNNSCGWPDFVKRGYYLDQPFNCKACGVAQVWTETQQKWWYEAAKGDIWAVAVLCRPCRRRERARKAAAREVHFSGLAAKAKKLT